MYPVKNSYVTMRYGVPGSYWAAGHHTGTDFHANVGTPVYASWGGVTEFAGGPYDSGSRGPAYGNHVVIRQRTKLGRTRYVLYCHLSGTATYRGEKISAGEFIGRSGNTGNTTGPHLHYEERNSPYGYYNNAAPVFLDYKPIIRVPIRLSAFRRRRSLAVLRVKRRLRRRHLGVEVNRMRDENFRTRYRRWQQRLGYHGADADGKPGQKSLEKLGFRVRK